MTRTAATLENVTVGTTVYRGKGKVAHTVTAVVVGSESVTLYAEPINRPGGLEVLRLSSWTVDA